MIEDYITSRLEPQILYYEKRSALFRREHNALSILTLFLMASIPFLTLLLDLSRCSVRYCSSGNRYIHTICDSLFPQRKRAMEIVPGDSTSFTC